jgi:hypothetical protein
MSGMHANSLAGSFKSPYTDRMKIETELTNKIKVTDIYWATEDEDLLAELPVDLTFDFPDSSNLEEDLTQAVADAYDVPINHLTYEVISE